MFNAVKLNRLVRKLLVPCYGVFLVSLASPAGAEEVGQGDWKQYKGEGYVLCDALLKELNRYKYPEKLGSCPWAVVVGYSEFKEPPWKELDAKKYEELLYQLQRLNSLGGEVYFSGVEDGSKEGSESRTESYSREKIRAFLKGGGQIRLWRTPLPKNFDLLAMDPKTAGPLNILQLRSPITQDRVLDLGLDQCPDIPRAKWTGSIRLVNNDLTGPDPRLAPSIDKVGLIYFNNTRMKIYKGIPHRLSSGGGSISIYRDDLPEPEFCRLIYSQSVQGGK